MNGLILDQTLDCGQCFRWTKADNIWTGVVNGKVYHLQQEALGTGSRYDIPGELRTYFDLDTDYDTVKAYLGSRDKVLKSAIEKGSGIRILRQDLWETLISFIISQNNNIPRIRGCIEKLCELFGESIEGGFYTFPEPGRLSLLSEEDLAPVRLGYRAAYIIKTAKTVAEEGFIRDDLSTYVGVGPKVKACVELFGRHQIDAFPIDVWVKRVMHRFYGIPENETAAMTEYAHQHFSPYGGIAQQYLFYSIRENNIT